ncbi:MAG: hypothetical protein GSR78_01400, partial [Desulfurococcales archaeon]|nr:hypothetical protein [Desulfurococcales archaeon]
MPQSRPSLLGSVSIWSFAVIIRSILALVYITILARFMSLEDFAAWGIIISIGNSLVLFSMVFGFWAPRIKDHREPPEVAWTTGLIGSI